MKLKLQSCQVSRAMLVKLVSDHQIYLCFSRPLMLLSIWKLHAQVSMGEEFCFFT